MNTPPGILARSPVWTKLPPLQQKSSVVLAGADGRIRAYDSTSGELQWQTSIDEEAEQLQGSDQVVVSANPHGITAFQASDGAALWSKRVRLRLESVSDETVVASRRGEVTALESSSGEVKWSAPSHEPVKTWRGAIVTVGGDRNRRETLQVREAASGRVKWSTTDGDITHVLPHGDNLLYSSLKFDRHSQEVQRLSFRDANGQVLWEHRCAGELRFAPVHSPDGQRLALSQKNPVNSSTSILTVLNAGTGRQLFQIPTGLKTDVIFLEDGSLMLSETEFSEVPGEEKTWLRCLDPLGEQKWVNAGKPDWLAGGSRTVTASGNTLRALSSQTGEPIWSLTFEDKLAPVGLTKNELMLLEGGSNLVTVDLDRGQKTRSVSSGDKLFIASQGRIVDHEGQLWSETVETSGQFAGTWEIPDPFHIAMRTAPTERNQRQAVFVDWDGDEKDDGTDPVLLDTSRQVVSWKDLTERDTDSDSRLETESLQGFSLWFDSDRNGEISSEAELNPLLAPAFDKGRIEMDKNLLWLAADSRFSENS